MVIICSSGGLGNRLFVFAHFIANACEFNYKIANPSFLAYAKHFETTSCDLLCRYPPHHSVRPSNLLQNLFFQCSETMYKVAPYIFSQCSSVRLQDINYYDKIGKNFDLAGREFIQARSCARFLVARGWLFRDFLNLRKHIEVVRQFFSPIAHHAENISRLLEKARNTCDVLIGVHIRQGDYRFFANGQYYYELPIYRRVMEEAANLFVNKKLTFLICSNSVLDKSVFKNFNCVIGTNQAVEDMYSFAQCDYLIGPPSTFTGWASFYGGVPVVTISKSDAKFTLENIHVWQG